MSYDEEKLCVQNVDGLPEDKRGGAWKALVAMIETAKSECAGIENEK